jgi:ankyrin repeat protein
VVAALKMFRTVRKGKNKEDALRITQRILLSLPQHMRERGRDTLGRKIPGPVEYITLREIKHGSKVLGWLWGHISLLVVEYLVSTGADSLSQGFFFKESIIHRAAIEGNLDVVEYLVSSHYVDVDLRSYDDWTPLHWAAESGKLKVIEYLQITQGADVNARSNNDWTPLRFAADMGYHEVVKYLLTHAADFNLKDNRGSTTLHIAAYRGRLETVQCPCQKTYNFIILNL